MNIAIIKAGGVGSRMGARIPKQFVCVDGKPVIIYTLEATQLWSYAWKAGMTFYVHMPKNSKLQN